MWESTFADNFWPGLWSNLIASAIVVVGAYFLIERRLHLREREERETERERDRAEQADHELRRRREVTLNVLRTIRDELEYDRDQAALAEKHLPKMEFPYPLFDVVGWTLMSQADVFSVLKGDTVEKLVKLYNRLRTANQLSSALDDVLFGPSAIAAATAANMMPTSLRAEQVKRFRAHRESTRDRLLERVRELEPHLAEGLALLDEELPQAQASDSPAVRSPNSCSAHSGQ